MPFIQISLTSGRTEEQIEKMIEDVTKSVSQAVDAPESAIHVVVTEVEPKYWGIAGESVKRRRERTK